MTTRLISAATAVMASVMLIAGGAWAQQEIDPRCAGIVDKSAFALCNARGKMGCGTADQNASDKACDKNAMVYEMIEGTPPPQICPCVFTSDRLLSIDDGWVSFSDNYACQQSGSFALDADGILLGFEQTLIRGLPDTFNNLRVEVVGSSTEANFECDYKNRGVSIGKVTRSVVVGDPVYDEVVDGYIEEYRACKAAIGLLVANFPFGTPLASNNCIFE